MHHYNLRSRKRKASLSETTIETPKPKIDEIPDSNKKTKIDWSEWVSATAISNYLLRDPVIDYYANYQNNINFGHHSNNNELKDDTLENYNKKKGIEFEERVIQYLRNDKFSPEMVVTVANNVAKDSQDFAKSAETINLMKKGVAFIYQAVLHNEKTKTYGVVDLLVRSDFLNALVETEVISETDAKVKAPIASGNYHYRVLDIKHTGMPLACDGKRLQNSKRFPAYKGQLYIYNEALGEMQGYKPPSGYILGKTYNFISKRVKTFGNYCFDRLGCVNFYDSDKQYGEAVRSAVQWIIDLRRNGKDWTLIPPSRKELYPNMCNTSCEKWMAIKEEHAKEIGELTLLWNCGTKNREIGHKNGIFSLNDPNCTAERLGINGEKTNPVADAIIDVNQMEDVKILPELIINNIKDWQNKTDLELYVDFEFFPEFLPLVQESNFTSTKPTTYTYLIGLYYVVKGKGKYKYFLMDRLDDQSERKVIQNFVDFVNELKKKYKVKKPNMYHWSNAEHSRFNQVNKKYRNVWERENFNWVDLLKIFQEEPIVIKGAWNFGLKEVAKAMYNNGMITTKWKEDTKCANGSDSIIGAFKCYQQAMQENKAIGKIKGMMDILDYNNVDCKVMYDMVKYLRDNHCDGTITCDDEDEEDYTE